MKQALSITRKELDSYFGSPMALIFVGIFLLTVHFSFFWVSGFFARGLADVRPLFQWMPLLLILLISTLTMRQWSEEQQTGTLEMLFTTPIRLTQLVLGKFLAVLLLVSVALLVTLSLPITVAILGRLDPGPVIGGYLAALLMASAYIAIGLFVSSLTDNQIVALLLTVIVCGAFYLIGSPALTGTNTGLTEVFRALGTGSHFESIERGVIDLRDLVYYGSLTLGFLTLNVIALDSKRWSKGLKLKDYRINRRLMTALVVVNLLILNIWLFKGGAARLDLTQNGEYTLSPVTRDLLSNLQEPLLIRGYFSQDTHPLLTPLIPQVRDMLQEYKVAAGDKLQVDFVDPRKDPAIEQEANQTYGIRSNPLQVSDRGKTSVVNAYNHILVRYGDQNATLNLLNMIDVQNTGSTTPEVRLRNLEYELTSSIQKSVYGFQNLDAVLASLDQPAQLTLYFTPNTLPDEVKTAPDVIKSVADKISSGAPGKFVFKAVNVADPASGVSADFLAKQYQIQPIDVGFLSPDTFYLHMVLEAGGKAQVIYPTGDVSDAAIRTQIESALKRSSSGSLKVVGVWVPGGGQQQQQQIQQYNAVQSALGQNFEVQPVTLSAGKAPDNIDTLVLIAPQNFTDLELYAIDQYLMRGGTAFIAASNYQLTVDFSGVPGLQPITGGVQQLLASYGITVEQKLVLDTQNAPFPVQSQRNLGGVMVNEVQPIPYPFFIDVRADGMDQGSQVMARLSSVVLNWASPISLDKDKTKEYKITTLLRSTANAWTTTETTIQPDMVLYPETGFKVEGDRAAQTLAVAVQGSLTSYFNGKPSPFAAATTPTDGSAAPTPDNSAQSAGFIGKSPDTTRLIVVGSNEFLDDTIFGLLSQLNVNTEGNVQFVQNSAGWFTEDISLSTIRAKSGSTRLLNAISDAEKTRWEIGNYLFALLALIGLGVFWQLRRRSEKPMVLVSPKKLQESASINPAQAQQGGD
jgi:ABC-2 type transport system permease protein